MNGNTIICIVFIAYMVWAFYSGNKVLAGKSEWLDRKAPLNRIVKLLLTFIIGSLIGAFYFFYLVIKLLKL